jgi:hypothetical protein
MLHIFDYQHCGRDMIPTKSISALHCVLSNVGRLLRIDGRSANLAVYLRLSPCSWLYPKHLTTGGVRKFDNSAAFFGPCWELLRHKQKQGIFILWVHPKQVK